MRAYFKLSETAWLVLSGLVVVGFVLRLSLFRIEPIANPDGMAYAAIGITVVSGTPPFSNLSGYVFAKDRPVYPILIGLANLLVADHTVAGAFVSMVLGSLAIVPGFLLAEKLYGVKAGYLAAFIMAWYPYLSNNASKDYNSATYVFFLLWAAYFGWIAYRENRPGWYAAFGVAAGLAYLTRFEVVGYLLLYVVVVALGRRTRSVANIGALLLAFMVTIVPFHLVNVIQTGSPLFWAKLEAGLWNHMGDRGLRQGDPLYDFFLRDKLGYVKHYVWGVGTMYSQYLPSLFPPLLLGIAAVGLAERFRRRTTSFGDAYLVALILLPIASIPLLRPSGRNLIDYLPFAIVLLAAGIVEVQRLITDGLAVRGAAAAPGVVLAALGGLVFVSTFPYTLRPVLRGQDPSTPVELMEMGRWMRQRLPAQKLIMTTGPQTAFYANTRFVEFPFDYRALVQEARRQGVGYVVLGSHQGPDPVTLHVLMGEIERNCDLVPVHTIERPSGWAKLYRVHDQPCRPAATAAVSGPDGASAR